MWYNIYLKIHFDKICNFILQIINNMNIRVVTDDKEFLSLNDDWDKLAKGLIPFQRFNWMYTWWKYFKESNDLKILVINDGDKIFGIAPLFIKNMSFFKFLTIRKLCFLGDGIAPYSDFLIQQDQNREQVFQLLFRFIFVHLSFDIVWLSNINSQNPHFDLWQKYTHLTNLKLEVTYRCPKICFSMYTSYKDYFDRLSKNHKQSLKFRQNKVMKSGIDVEYVFKRDITEEDMKTIATVHIKRQTFLSQRNIPGRFSYFANTKIMDFLKDYFCRCNHDTKILAYMKFNGLPVSYILLIANENTLFYWNTAFDNDYAFFSPTKLLINELIKYAFENNFTHLDFLRGSNLYKLQWSNDMSVNYQLKIRKTIKAKLSYLYKSVAPEFLLPKKLRIQTLE